MTLRDRVYRALKKAGYPTENLEKSIAGLVEHCEEILSYPGLFVLGLGLRTNKNGQLQIHLICLVDTDIVSAEEKTDLLWNVPSLIQGKTFEGRIRVEVLLISSSEVEKYLSDTTRDDETLLLRLASRDLTQEAFERVKKNVWDNWVDKDDPESIAWFKRFPTPQLAS